MPFVRRVSALWVLVFSLCMIFSGCITQRNAPNPVFSGPIPLIEKIEQQNPLLAEEIRKLPEILDGIDAHDQTALKHISANYAQQPAAFDQAFEQMYDTGLPEFRKYCTPLQALFWVAMRYPLSKKDLISEYSLRTLLEEAWTYDPIPDPVLMAELVASIKDDDLRAFYEKKRKKKQTILFLMAQDAEANPEMFPPKTARTIIALSKVSYWDDFSTVMDRLNAPKLLDFYTRQKISYRHWYQISSYNDAVGDARYVFRTKSGDCLYICEFIATALVKNGYRAWVQKVAPTDFIGGAWHAHTVFEEKGKSYIIDNGTPFPAGISEYK